MRFIDLFAGIGGFHYGLNRSCQKETERLWETNKKKIRSGENQSKVKRFKGLADSKTKPQQHTGWGSTGQFVCVYANEWDKYANSIYKKHFGECDSRDIRTVDAHELPDFDLLCGGFPCQAFSIAGKRGGFDDTRGTLFFEIARILREKKPRLLLLENVKGLLSHDNGNTFKTIITTLVELGYDIQWQVLNSKNFGVPQNRERVFIVGHLRGTPRPKIFPITKGNGLHSNEITKSVSDAQRIYDTKGIAKTLKGLGGGLGAKTGLYAVPIKFLERNQKNYQGDYSFTVDSVNTGGVMKDMRIRRLTPVECERLQGFPDNWTEGISDTQRYKCLGNAVTTNVITYLGKLLVTGGEE